MEINIDEIVKNLDDLKKKKAELDFYLKQTEKEIEQEELKLQAVLNQLDVNYMQHGVYSFGWITKKRKAFDQKLFGSEHPDLLEKFKIEKETKSFEFKIGA